MKFTWLVLLSCLALAARADVFEHPVKNHPGQQQALQELTQLMQQQGSVAGEFIQTRHLQVLARPIITRGKFALTPQQFIWQIESPFAIGYQFSEQKLVRELDGQRQIIEPSSEPMLYGFFSFFSSLFTLSEQSLDTLFTIYYLPAPDGDDWVLGLKPRQESLARSLRQLIIYGSTTQILKVQLIEQNDDHTELAFTYPPAQPVPTP